MVTCLMGWGGRPNLYIQTTNRHGSKLEQQLSITPQLHHTLGSRTKPPLVLLTLSQVAEIVGETWGSFGICVEMFPVLKKNWFRGVKATFFVRTTKMLMSFFVREEIKSKGIEARPSVFVAVGPKHVYTLKSPLSHYLFVHHSCSWRC